MSRIQLWLLASIFILSLEWVVMTVVLAIMFRQPIIAIFGLSTFLFSWSLIFSLCLQCYKTDFKERRFISQSDSGSFLIYLHEHMLSRIVFPAMNLWHNPNTFKWIFYLAEVVFLFSVIATSILGVCFLFLPIESLVGHRMGVIIWGGLAILLFQYGCLNILSIVRRAMLTLDRF